MNVVPITPTTPACFGVMCQRHAECARYHLIDNAPHDQLRIASCEQGPERPLFVPREGGQ
ncbi:hypothetical protein [Eleftheria terrae]|uniref:hypothetical protein n=1 Tax=Eleftheria terrae TaxID=1597781 RepID=UPI00263A6DCB|nr:hypothetical protein [Eleftheria terrae]WKB53002.1 hypothetical protein N7L95_00945 [Eleftheria terrae]